jgi:GH18 family chitinase
MRVQFLFNTARKTVVTYDDTYSLADKAAFAKNNGMAGCFTWSLDQVRLFRSPGGSDADACAGRWLYPPERDPLGPGKVTRTNTVLADRAPYFVRLPGS